MRGISKAISESLRPLQEMQRKLSASFEPLIESVAIMTESTQEISQQLSLCCTRLAEIFEHLPEETRTALTLLGQRGWYISIQMPLPAFYENAKQIELENYHEVDEWMITFYEDNLDKIKLDLLERFPHRSTILECAFEAHERGNYELSIPVLLAQADGICCELTGIQLYSRRKGRPITADIIEQRAIDPFSVAIMEPLRLPLPISASPRDRKADEYPSGSLNRHQILHGEIVDYATRVNGYKAISLLQYVATILDRDIFEGEG
jgi:hypothetical protein